MSDYILHNGDCLEYMQTMTAGSIDAVVTDPPYGIANVWKGGFGKGWKKSKEQAKKRNSWDLSPPKKIVFDKLLSVARVNVIWGGNYFELPLSRGWLVWNKPERNFSLSEAELAWTNIDMPIRVFDYRRSDSGREHPTQKPLALMKWCIKLVSKPGDVIFDPFMGSGTTGVAAIQLGRKFIGCEIDEEYFKIAQRRIESAALQPLLMTERKTEHIEQIALDAEKTTTND